MAQVPGADREESVHAPFAIRKTARCADERLQTERNYYKTGFVGIPGVGDGFSLKRKRALSFEGTLIRIIHSINRIS
jgi:hypothetical protein